MHTSILPHMIQGYMAAHKELPLYLLKETDFFRCVTFSPVLYGKTVSELHRGNLRDNNNPENRYSRVFPTEKISYWASNHDAAVAEVKKHGAGTSILHFWAYDDATSFLPTQTDMTPLKIIDGVTLNFKSILLKVEEGAELTEVEKRLLCRILDEKPDGLAYESQVDSSAISFIFFERGFAKLSLRTVRVRLGEKNRSNSIYCAGSSDYTPCLSGYGYSFEPILRTMYHKDYENTDEYKKRKQVLDGYEKELVAYYRKNK